MVCLVVRNNSSDQSSSWLCFLFILNIVLFLLFFAADSNFCNCVFVGLTLFSWEFGVFYNTVTHYWENFNLVSLIFSKIVKIGIDSDPSTFIPYTFFNCPTNFICWIAFGSSSNSFCLLKSTAINLEWFSI